MHGRYDHANWSWRSCIALLELSSEPVQLINYARLAKTHATHRQLGIGSVSKNKTKKQNKMKQKQTNLELRGLHEPSLQLQKDFR